MKILGASNDGGTALHKAAESGYEAVVRLLPEKGADVDAKTNDGGTAPTLGGRDYLTYTFD
jgi:ankyrin repeat protein